MDDDEPPPPPPPSSPPLEGTTIGKYIARFRYEEPQPREVRAAAQQGDFWWTKSPRYSRSPSPPSTWASGGVFEFPEEEDGGEEDPGEKSGGKSQGEDEESVASVENKLRHRLGVWGSVDGELEAEKREAPPPMMQSWGSAGWSSVEIEDGEIELEEEDPEKVIERVRKRLGWASSSLSSSHQRPIELRLSIGSEQRRTMKPPLSPHSIQSAASSGRAGERSSRGSRTGDDFIYDDPAMVSIGIAEAKEYREPTLMQKAMHYESKVEEETTAQPAQSMSSDERSETESQDNDLGLLRCTSTPRSSIGSLCSSHHSQDSMRTHENEGLESFPNETLDAFSSEPSQSNDEDHDVDGRSLAKSRENVFSKEVIELSLPFTENPARNEDHGANGDSTAESQANIANEQMIELSLPSTESPARNGSIGRFVTSPSKSLTSSLSQSDDGVVHRETVKTLDSLVNFVVHSWSTEVTEAVAEQHKESPRQFDVEEGEEDSQSDGEKSEAAGKRVPEIEVNRLSTSSEDEELVVELLSSSATEQEDLHLGGTSGSISAEVLEKAEQVEDAMGTNAIPGEEDDEIVQMLLERISLLEEALSQIAK